MNGPQKYTVAAAIAIGIGTGAVYTSLRYLRLRETMHFTPDGIEPHTGGLIPWDDIEEMTVTSKGGQHLLEVSLTDPARYYGSHDLGDSAPLRWNVSNAKYGQQAVEDAVTYRAALPA